MRLAELAADIVDTSLMVGRRIWSAVGQVGHVDRAHAGADEDLRALVLSQRRQQGRQGPTS